MAKKNVQNRPRTESRSLRNIPQNTANSLAPSRAPLPPSRRRESGLPTNRQAADAIAIPASARINAERRRRRRRSSSSSSSSRTPTSRDQVAIIRQEINVAQDQGFLRGMSMQR